MEVLGQFHPQIVHTPIALLIFSAFFALVGRLFDRDWLRKTAMVMLMIGALSAFVAMRSGFYAHGVPEHEQGVPEEAIDEHADKALITFRLAMAALLAYVIATRLKGPAKTAVNVIGLTLQIFAAVGVGFTCHEGGELVYEYGANVKVDGKLVKNPGADEHHEAWLKRRAARAARADSIERAGSTK